MTTLSCTARTTRQSADWETKREPTLLPQVGSEYLDQADLECRNLAMPMQKAQ
jgi:hypothetical protein